ncbi:MAG: hypothetical protein AB1806_13185 [Acidobacteriota bacterium]
MSEQCVRPNGIWGTVREALSRHGIDVDVVCEGKPGSQARVICVASNLGDRVEELAQSARDQVIMVRIDKESVDALDAWVATGVAKSRSEAAALFLREGLRLRAGELEDLKEALAKVEDARRELHERAKSVLGGDRSDRSASGIASD